MLLQMTSAGAMGGGVSSAIARALGSGDAAAARKLVVHALVIAAAMGVGFTVLVLLFGPWLYQLLGGRGETLEHALRYSNIVFGGAITVWIANTLSSVLRGSGNMLTPAVTLIGAALVHLPLSATLVARIGIAGAGIAYVTTFGIAALVMAAIVFRRSSLLRPQREDWTLEWRRFREILRVGAISSLNALQTVLTAVIVTGFVGRYGAAALAGYGVGLRLELLQIPLVFAVGQALVVLVGTHIGAGRAERAKQIAWIGAGVRGLDQPRHRHHGCAVSARRGSVSSAATPRCWKRLALPAHRGAVLSVPRRGHRALLRLAGRRTRAAAGARRHGAPRAGDRRRADGRFAAGRVHRHRRCDDRLWRADHLVRRLAKMEMNDRSQKSWPKPSRAPASRRAKSSRSC